MKNQRVLLRLGFFKRVNHWVPHPAKIETGGEDAFIATDSVLGVCDGVSWWGNNYKGLASAGMFSEALVRSAFEVISDDWMCFPDERPNPGLRLMQSAYERLKPQVDDGAVFFKAYREREKSGQTTTTLEQPPSLLIGTSTALFAAVTPSGELNIANLGDCTCIVIRNGKIVLETEEQHHQFEFPYQLGTGSSDVPEDALITQIPLQLDDVVVIGSDGIFDNMYPHEVAALFSERMEEITEKMELVLDPKSLQMPIPALMKPDEKQLMRTIEVANHRKISALTEDDRDMLALHVAALQCLRIASLNSVDPRCDTPYASRCIQEAIYHQGGKPDDMTLVAAVVGRNDVSFGERVDKSNLPISVPYKNWP